MLIYLCTIVSKFREADTPFCVQAPMRYRVELEEKYGDRAYTFMFTLLYTTVGVMKHGNLFFALLVDYDCIPNEAFTLFIM